MPKSQTTVPLPNVSEFLENLDRLTGQCATLLGVKSQSIRIPTTIRVQMRVLARLNTYWGRNRTVYSGLVEAGAQTARAQTRGAGA